MRYGYARVATEEQSLARQRSALGDAGCDQIIEEVQSGAPRGNLRRFVPAELRAATEPVSARDVAAALIKAKGLDTGRSSVGEARRRVGACLRALKLGGPIQEMAQVGEFKTWELTPNS